MVKNFVFAVFCTADSIDPDQTPRFVASELGLLCLHISCKRVSSQKC